MAGAPARAGIGNASLAALRLLIDAADAEATRSAGPRFFHFVMGGGTPAALGADWLTSALDQIAFNWVSSPFAMHMEQVAVGWLADLFGLPNTWSGVLTTGATSANFTGLAAARRWWGLQHGVDVEQDGMSALPAVPVLASGIAHVSAIKALAMLGIGRRQVRTLAADGTGRLDIDAMEAELRKQDGAPAILLATAGEPNAGAFDPIDEMADLARTYSAWLHVDGAFGVFAAVSPATRHLVRGLDRAHSVAVDGHKWLNVPTTAARPSSTTQTSIARPSPRRPPIWVRPSGIGPSSAIWGRRCRGARGHWRCGRRCTRTAAADTRRWSSATFGWRGD